MAQRATLHELDKYILPILEESLGLANFSLIRLQLNAYQSISETGRINNILREGLKDETV